MWSGSIRKTEKKEVGGCKQPNDLLFGCNINQLKSKTKHKMDEKS
jgi:hypothetical protein